MFRGVGVSQTSHTVYFGEVLRGLAGLPDQSVHAVVTSPPYFGLRSYLPDDHPDKSREIGLEETPDAYVARMVTVFREVRRVLRDDGTLWLNLGDTYAANRGYQVKGTICRDVGNTLGMRVPDGLKPKDLIGIPWRVAFGLQADGWYLRSAIPWVKANPLPESVIDRPTVSHEYWFLLAKSGAPVYWTHRDGAGQRTLPAPDYRWTDRSTGEETATEPEGWQDEQMRDGTKRWRRTNLWRGVDYYYDTDAVRVAHKQVLPTPAWDEKDYHQEFLAHQQMHGSKGRPKGIAGFSPNGRNRRTSDWWHESVDALIADLEGYTAHLKAVRANRGACFGPAGEPMSLNFSTKPFKGAHFATFNVNLITPLIRISTSEKGCCPVCGAPWRRVTERAREHGATPDAGGKTADLAETDRWNRLDRRRKAARAAGEDHSNPFRHGTTLGWQPTCTCSQDNPVPCTVLDPFMGSGTVAEACKALGRSSIGCDIDARNQEYIERRLQITPSTLEQVLGLAEYRFVRV